MAPIRFAKLGIAADFLLDIVFPKFCAGCHAEGSWLCPPCREAMPVGVNSCFACERRMPDGSTCPHCVGKTRIRRFVAPFRYSNRSAKELIHLLKFSFVREIAPLLAEFLVESLKKYSIGIPEKACLAPIPLHKKRLRERGFNQAEEIALAISSATGIPVNNDLLVRDIYRTPQSEIKKRDKRVENIKGVFRTRADVPKGTTVILIDDVSTTGATIEEAARVLKQAGAKKVWAFVIAR